MGLLTDTECSIHVLHDVEKNFPLFLSLLVIFTCKYVNAGFVCFASNRHQFKENAEGRPSGNGTP